MQAFALTLHAYFTTSLSVFFGSDFYLEHNWSSATGWANPAIKALPLQRSWQAGWEEEPGEQACAAWRAVLSGCWWRLEVRANNFWVRGRSLSSSPWGRRHSQQRPCSMPCVAQGRRHKAASSALGGCRSFLFMLPFFCFKIRQTQKLFLTAFSILQEFQCS